MKKVAMVSCLMAGFISLISPCLAAEPQSESVDPTTLLRKVMTGYQGWFRCPGDATNLGWVHWSRNRKQLTPETLNVDLWPDTREYTAAELYPAPGFTIDGGKQAYLYSADNPATVLRHFQWMQDYGIDGAWLQRFLVGLPGGRASKGGIYESNRRMIDHVAQAAEKTGRVWTISYDIAQRPTTEIFDSLTADWKKLVDEGVTRGPRYLHHKGLPVVQIWGFYYNNQTNLMTAEVANKLIDFFQTPGPYQAFLVGGGSWNWRTVPDPEWQKYYRRFGAYCPWNVGNRTSDKGGKPVAAATKTWHDDLHDCQERGVIWMPVVYPGFSWVNIMQARNAERILTIPRRDGQFLWEQFYALAQLKVDCAYLAMFDEVDEGTAIYKLATSSRVDSFTIQRDKLPSDWYLRVTREGIKMLHGQRPITAEIPIKP